MVAYLCSILKVTLQFGFSSVGELTRKRWTYTPKETQSKRTLALLELDSAKNGEYDFRKVWKRAVRV